MQDEITLFAQDILSQIIRFLPSLGLALLVILFGYAFGRLIEKMSKRFILYLNRVSNEALEKKSLGVNLTKSSVAISRSLFWIIWVISLVISIRVLRLDFLSNWLEGIISFMPNVFVAVVILFAGIISGRLLNDIVSSAASSTGLSNGQSLGKIVRYLILFVAIVVAVDQLGIDVNFITTLVSIVVAALLFGASLAFGLGAKTSVSNILGAYYARKTYQLGNLIQIGEITGVIIKITDHEIAIESSLGRINIPAKDFNESTVTLLNSSQV
jgi:small-conductance mechanosensitive channel